MTVIVGIWIVAAWAAGMVGVHRLLARNGGKCPR